MTPRLRAPGALSAAFLGWFGLLACSGDGSGAGSNAGLTASTTGAGGTAAAVSTGGGPTTGGPTTSSNGSVASSTGAGQTITVTGTTSAGTTSVGTTSAGTTTTDGGVTGTTSVSGTTGLPTTTGAGGAASTTGGDTSGNAGTSSVTSTTDGAGGTTMIPDQGDRSVEGTCARWNADTADMSEGTWSGSVASCDAGDISADGRANALRLFNLYRWLADLPSVTTTAERDQQAQECALMMDANNSLSHEPSMSWTCYSTPGAQGARTSNISSGPGVSSVALYMTDRGNESTMGHRRIILSNWLGPIGLGSTGEGGSSCMQNIGGDGDAGKEWVAWPPPGVFPIQAYADNWSSLTDTGWSIQSEDIQLSGSQVTVSSGGQNLSVNTTPLTGNYGSTNGIRIDPNGWDVEAGETYSVSVSGTDITYDIQFVDCDQF